MLRKDNSDCSVEKKKKNLRKLQEAQSRTWDRNDGGSEKSQWRDEKWTVCGYNLVVEPTEFLLNWMLGLRKTEESDTTLGFRLEQLERWSFYQLR